MTNTLLGFISGLILGSMAGVVVMALCAASKNGEMEDVMSDMRRENEND